MHTPQVDRDEGRDVSERIALGMLKGSGAGAATGEALYDSRLFNQVITHIHTHTHLVTDTDTLMHTHTSMHTHPTITQTAITQTYKHTILSY